MKKPITWEQITGPSRKSRIVDRRCEVVVMLCRRFQGMTLAEIGELLGGRTPATIYHEINRFYER